MYAVVNNSSLSDLLFGITADDILVGRLVCLVRPRSLSVAVRLAWHVYVCRLSVKHAGVCQQV